MQALRVAPIVEGHGEVEAVRVLLQRIWTEAIGGDYVEIMHPVRQPKSRLLQERGIERAVKLADAKLRQAPGGMAALILVIIDADRDCPAQLGPPLAERARASTHIEVECVVANVEFETWFVGSAQSLEQFLLLGDAPLPAAPESLHLGKGWIKGRFRSAKYSETVDQARLTAKMDVQACRRNCPSFARLCSKLEAIHARAR